MTLNDEVRSIIDSQISDGRQIGVQVCAFQYGNKIVDTWAGTMGPNDDRPVQGDSLFCSWSTTKGVAATALHILADKGLIEYDAPVTKYWPAFGKHGKDKLTVAQAMSHQAGIYALPKPLKVEQLTDWESGIKHVENAAPAFQPGTKTGYHGVTFGWIVGGIIKGATGRHIQDVITNDIAKPLGIEDEMYVGIPDNVEDKLTTLEIWDSTEFEYPDEHPFFDALPHELWDYINDMRVRKACIPSINGHFTANALAKMYGALANGGQLGNMRLVSEERIEEMRRMMTDDTDVVIGVPGRKGVGYFLGGIDRSAYGRRESVFGHGGAGGSIAFSDPVVGLSIAITLNKMLRELDVTTSRVAEICNLIRDDRGV
jgi:CubicO group peptidase (beta-lactamase class C family)